MSQSTKLRDQICRVGESLFSRGLTPRSTGNISVRLDDNTLLMTPANVSLGDLDPAALSHVDADGTHLAGDKPTKDAFLHTCMYCERPSAGAVVHLHCTHAVAVSILAEVDAENVLPPLTAYYQMRVDTLPLIPCFAPGDRGLALAVKQKAGKHHAVLLANHGPVVAGKSLSDAQYAIEELEETAKLYLMLRGHELRVLTDTQVAELRPRF